MWGVETHLSRNRHLRTTLKSHRTRRTIGVVEDDGNAGFRDACLATLIDEVLLVLRTHLPHPCKAKGQFLALSSESLIGTMPPPIPEYPWTADADRPVRYQQE